MKIERTNIDGLLIITPRVFQDPRGWFYESYHEDRLRDDAGILHHFAQDNHSFSCKNTLRGLHFQRTPGQAKLIRCTKGTIWDVAVDIRRASPTFGKSFGVELSSENITQLYIPVGFAHGFCVLSDYAEVQYKCSTIYDGETEDGIAWDDPDLAIQWPISDPIISERDQTNQSFADFCST